MAFKLKSGNTTPFKSMGSSPAKFLGLGKKSEEKSEGAPAEQGEAKAAKPSKAGGLLGKVLDPLGIVKKVKKVFTKGDKDKEGKAGKPQEKKAVDVSAMGEAGTKAQE